MTDAVLDDISHRRFNPLKNTWILVSPHRTKRPWQGQQEPASQTTLPSYDPSCYLCPGNKRAQGDVNPRYENTFVFVNDYSAVKESQAEYSPPSEHVNDLASSLLRAESVTGRCYVLTFSPNHNLTLADLSPSQILPIIQTWTQIYLTHLSPSSPLSKYPPAAPETAGPAIPRPSHQYRYMQIFENKGSAMGCSNPHPHGQIWTVTHLPEEPALELENMIAYRHTHNNAHLLQDYANLEIEQKSRLVYQNTTFITLVPWWATWPYEILILPLLPIPCLSSLSPAQQQDLAAAISDITKRYDNLFSCHFPYSMGIHQAPLEGSAEEIEASYLHVHLYPPLLRSATVRKFLVGYEMLAEPQRDLTPEMAAGKLRALDGGRVYRDTTNMEGKS